MANKELALMSDLDRFFDRSVFGGVRWPGFTAMVPSDLTKWIPDVDVFERGTLLVTKVDLPGMKKEDVNVEVADGRLTISGKRQRETTENKDNVYRTERASGTFYRAVPLPEGVKHEDVKATFTDGVLEVCVPIPPKAMTAANRKVLIEEGAAVKQG